MRIKAPCFVCLLLDTTCCYWKLEQLPNHSGQKRIPAITTPATNYSSKMRTAAWIVVALCTFDILSASYLLTPFLKDRYISWNLEGNSFFEGCIASVKVDANGVPNGHYNMSQKQNASILPYNRCPWAENKISICGDLYLDPHEECDYGSMNGIVQICPYGIKECFGCTKECKLSASLGSVSYCGDGAVDSGEECDDGNSNYEDGCTPFCKLECVNGIVDEQDKNLKCAICNPGYTGPYCKELKCYKGILDSEDVDKKCSNCFTGWSGDYCNEPKCQNGKLSVDNQYGHCSSCNEGFFGLYCQFNLADFSAEEKEKISAQLKDQSEKMEESKDLQIGENKGLSFDATEHHSFPSELSETSHHMTSETIEEESLDQTLEKSSFEEMSTVESSNSFDSISSEFSKDHTDIRAVKKSPKIPTKKRNLLKSNSSKRNTSKRNISKKSTTISDEDTIPFVEDSDFVGLIHSLLQKQQEKRQKSAAFKYLLVGGVAFSGIISILLIIIIVFSSKKGKSKIVHV